MNVFNVEFHHRGYVALMSSSSIFDKGNYVVRYGWSILKDGRQMTHNAKYEYEQVFSLTPTQAMNDALAAIDEFVDKDEAWQLLMVECPDTVKLKPKPPKPKPEPSKPEPQPPRHENFVMVVPAPEDERPWWRRLLPF